MYYKPTFFEYQVVLDQDGNIIVGADPNNPGNYDTVVTRTAASTFIAEHTQSLPGMATVQFDYYDAENEYSIPGRWVTTVLSPENNIIYQSILNKTASQEDIDSIDELIFNSPEGIACVPQVTS